MRPLLYLCAATIGYEDTNFLVEFAARDGDLLSEQKSGLKARVFDGLADNLDAPSREL